MLFDSALLVLGYALIFMSAWPALHFSKVGQLAYLPANPRITLNVSVVTAGIGIVGLVVAIFIPTISTWAIPIAFFVGGPLGGDLGIRYARSIGNYLVLHLLGFGGTVLAGIAVVW